MVVLLRSLKIFGCKRWTTGKTSSANLASLNEMLQLLSVFYFDPARIVVCTVEFPPRLKLNKVVFFSYSDLIVASTHVPADSLLTPQLHRQDFDPAAQYLRWSKLSLAGLLRS